MSKIFETFRGQVEQISRDVAEFVDYVNATPLSITTERLDVIRAKEEQLDILIEQAESTVRSIRENEGSSDDLDDDELDEYHRLERVLIQQAQLQWETVEKFNGPPLEPGWNQ